MSVTADSQADQQAHRLHGARDRIAAAIGITPDEAIADIEAGLRRAGHLSDSLDADAADRALTAAAQADGRALADHLYGAR